MITADAFLEALNLPTEHPYIPYDASASDIPDAVAPKEWSITNYFYSWKDSPSSSPAAQDLTSSIDCSSTLPMPSWAAKFTSNNVCNSEVDGAPPAIAAGSNNTSTEVSFLEEISPCLVAMFHMNIILWAPIVLLICLRRLMKKPLPRNQRIDRQDGGESETNKQTASSKTFPPIITRADQHLPVMTHAKKNQTTHQGKKAKAIQDTLSFFVYPTNVFSKAESQDEAAMSSPTGGYFTYIVGLFFSALVMTDPMYVFEFSQAALVLIHLLIITLGMKRLGAKVALYTALPVSAIAFYMIAHQDLNLPTFSPGLYYDESNSLVTTAVSKWPIDKRTYDDGRGTPWMMTGDTRTGLPFMFYKIPEIDFQRRWIPLPDEKEAVILDVAFPSNNVIESNKRVYLVLHGINGDSHEGYVADFVDRQVRQGNIVAVMVTRGLGDSPILGDNILHFARTKDVEAAARALKTAIREVSDDGGLLLSGVGYSMGAITLANYVATSGAQCDLDAAVTISGALDTTQQVKFLRSASLWQPFITKALRDTLLSSFGNKIRSRLSQQQLQESIKAATLVDFDRTFFVPYHDFESLEDYYSRLGAMGDFVSYDNPGRIANVSIPLLCVHSLDDPVGYWGVYRDPESVVHLGKGNTVLLFTKRGGHVGWPLGMNPSIEAWKWMSDIASSFAEAVDIARKEDSDIIISGKKY